MNSIQYFQLLPRPRFLQKQYCISLEEHVPSLASNVSRLMLWVRCAIVSQHIVVPRWWLCKELGLPRCPWVVCLGATSHKAPIHSPNVLLFEITQDWIKRRSSIAGHVLRADYRTALGIQLWGNGCQTSTEWTITMERLVVVKRNHIRGVKHPAARVATISVHINISRVDGIDSSSKRLRRRHITSPLKSSLQQVSTAGRLVIKWSTNAIKMS